MDPLLNQAVALLEEGGLPRGWARDQIVHSPGESSSPQAGPGDAQQGLGVLEICEKQNEVNEV